MCGQMVAYPLDNIPLNIGWFVLIEIQHYSNKGGPVLLLSSLITELYRQFEVDEFQKISWVSPKTPNYPLKIREERALRKSKKRKVDLGRLVEDDVGSYRPSIVGPFYEISDEMRTTKELVSKILRV